MADMAQLGSVPSVAFHEMRDLARPSQRSGHLLLADPSGERAVLHGGLGMSVREYYNDTWIYHFAAERWESLPLHSARVPFRGFGQAGVIVPSSPHGELTLVVHGGIGISGESSAEGYARPLRDHIVPWTALPLRGAYVGRAVWGHSWSVVTHGSLRPKCMIVAFGGNDSARSYNDTYHIDPETWESVLVESAQAPAPRRRHGHAVHRERYVLIFGGRDEAEDFFDDLWCYNSSVGVWVALQHRGPHLGIVFSEYDCAEHLAAALPPPVDIGRPEWPPPRTGLSAFIVDDKFYIFGGFHYSRRSWEMSTIRGVWGYDLRSGAWSQPRHRCGTDLFVTMAGVVPDPRSTKGFPAALMFGGRRNDFPLHDQYRLVFFYPDSSLRNMTLEWVGQHRGQLGNVRGALPQHIAHDLKEVDGAQVTTL